MDSSKIDVLDAASRIDQEWVNFIAARVDDYVVRIMVQENTSHWHHHSTGDELFLVLEGQYAIDLEDGSVTLDPGQMYAVPKMTTHRTRAIQRSVVVCFESANNDIKGS